MVGSAAILTTLAPQRGSAVAEGTANPMKPKSLYTSNALIRSMFLSRDFLPDGDLSKDAWTEEENAILIEAHGEIGNKWSEIAKRLPGRFETASAFAIG